LHLLVVDLIGDALKMPANIFATKPKETLLKWLAEMQPNGRRESTSGEAECRADHFLSLVNDVGEVRDRKLRDAEHQAQIRAWLDDAAADNFEIVVSLCEHAMIHRIERREL
jgi:hypothetical protein